MSPAEFEAKNDFRLYLQDTLQRAAARTYEIQPRVYLEIDGKGYVECGYCDRRFVLKTDPHARGDKELFPGDLPEPGDASVA